MALTRSSKSRSGQAELSAQDERSEDEASQHGPESSEEDNKALQMAQNMRKDVKLSASPDQGGAGG